VPSAFLRALGDTAQRETRVYLTVVAKCDELPGMTFATCEMFFEFAHIPLAFANLFAMLRSLNENRIAR